jgi:AI-2 transport protein TqsA
MALDLPTVSRVPIRLESSLRVIVLLAGLVIIGFGIHASRDVIVPLLLAICLVLAVQPLVDNLERRRIPSSIAVTCGMLTLLVGIGFFFATLAYGASELLADLPKYETAAKELQKSTVTWLATRGLVRAALALQGTQVGVFLMTHSGGLLSVVPTLVSHAVFVLLLTLFMLIERNSMKARLLSGLHQFAVENRYVIRDVQRYLGTKTLLSVGTGTLVTLLCFTLGIPNAPLWGAVAFVCNFIPVAGALISAAPPIALALLSRDLPTIFSLIVGFLVIKGVVGNIVEPRMLGNSFGLSPLSVVVAIVVWGALLGPAGALLSVPLTSAFRIALAHMRDFEWLNLLLTLGPSEVPTSTHVPPPPVVVRPQPIEDPPG